MTTTDRIAQLEARAVTHRSAALALYSMGQHDEQAMRLLDTADGIWRTLKALKRTQRVGKRRALTLVAP